MSNLSGNRKTIWCMPGYLKILRTGSTEVDEQLTTLSTLPEDPESDP